MRGSGLRSAVYVDIRHAYRCWVGSGITLVEAFGAYRYRGSRAPLLVGEASASASDRLGHRPAGH